MFFIKTTRTLIVVYKGAMYRVCGSRLDPNFGVWPAVGKDFYLQLRSEKMHVLAVFIDKYLRPCSCSSPNFRAIKTYKNPKSTKKVKPSKYKRLKYRPSL